MNDVITCVNKMKMNAADVAVEFAVKKLTSPYNFNLLAFKVPLATSHSQTEHSSAIQIFFLCDVFCAFTNVTEC